MRTTLDSFGDCLAEVSPAARGIANSIPQSIATLWRTQGAGMTIEFSMSMMDSAVSVGLAVLKACE